MMVSHLQSSENQFDCGQKIGRNKNIDKVTDKNITLITLYRQENISLIVRISDACSNWMGLYPSNNVRNPISLKQTVD
jgi:hypothetical protein